MLGLLWSPHTLQSPLGRPALSLYLAEEGEEEPPMDAAAADMEELARTWHQREAMTKSPQGIAEAFSLQWYLTVEHTRYSRQGHWLPELLGFAKHPGESVLCLGDSMGTDAVQYARHGAHVTVCHPQQQHLGLVRRNFELRGLPVRCLHADGQYLPLADGIIDVVYFAALPDASRELSLSPAEIYRVLKPGGKVSVLLPARAPAWWRWLLARDASGQGFGRRQTCKWFDRFENHRVWRRSLRRRHLIWPCRWMPRTLLEPVIGRILVMNAFKPISSVLLRAAA